VPGAGCRVAENYPSALGTRHPALLLKFVMPIAPLLSVHRSARGVGHHGRLHRSAESAVLPRRSAHSRTDGGVPRPSLRAALGSV